MTAPDVTAADAAAPEVTSTDASATREASVDILIVDDDPRLRERLHRAMTARGLSAAAAGDPSVAVALATDRSFTHAVVDLRMPGGSGVELIPQLLRVAPGIRIVVLTGYGSIATAVEAIRRGASDYLTKPADADQVLGALGLEASAERVETTAETTPSAPSLERVEWEHIQRVLTDCGGNVTQAARVLGVHRRTLQRKLSVVPRRD